MIDMLGDLFILFVFFAVVWTYIPPAWRFSIRKHAGIICRQLLEALAAGAEIAERFMYHAVTGRPLAMDAPAPKILDTAPAAEPPAVDNNPPDGQTDRQTDRRDPDLLAGRMLRLDVTRNGVVKSMILAGWSKSQMRAVIKGDNNTLGLEYDRLAAELQELGQIDPPSREYISDLAARVDREVRSA